jgi:transposase
LRLSFDRLAGVVREQLGGDPRGDVLFVFHNKRRTHVKLLWHESSGYRILYTRLDRGRYRIPVAIPADASRVQISQRELDILLEGIDMSIVRAARKQRRCAS